MANQDRVNFVWAESALTTIPPIPVSEVAYRDTTQTPEQMEVGQQYDTIYNSARHNQLLFLLTSVAKTLCENGIMPFLAGQEYSQYARCIFTDGKLYTASRAILANEQPYPTPGDDSGVWTTEETGENLVPDSRRVIAGTGLTGGGPLSADVTLTVKLTNSVNLTDSTTAASATAVKTAYDLANSKQPNLGFTPVQQGGGANQRPNKVYLGWDGGAVRVQVDNTDLGQLVTTLAGQQKAPNAAWADGAQFALRLRREGNVDTIWNWVGQEGQPSHVWGSNDGTNMFIWNPANFSVKFANSAGSAPANGGTSWATTVVPNVAFVGRGGALPKGGTWHYIYVPYDNHHLRCATLAGGATVPSNDGGIAIRIA